MRKVFLSLFVLLAPFTLRGNDDEMHEFRGKHFLASYLECDKEALCDEQRLMQVMLNAVGKSGAQILNYSSHVFPGHGVTMVILLSESHASIHTYPEYGACFVDLFTCGNRCSHIPFDEALKEYLKPEEVNQKVLVRHTDIEEHVPGFHK
jgi:S-adenosylmethionine decarboxylase